MMRSLAAEPRSSPLPGQVPWVWGAVYALVLMVTYLLLSLLYARTLPRLASDNDLWFGSDVARHVGWARVAGWWDRAQWHPLTALLMKAWQALCGWMEGIGVPPMIYLAVPGFTLTAVAIVVAAWLLTRRGGELTPVTLALGVVAFVSVGPTLVFAPIPESHVIGGAALLLQLVLTGELLGGEKGTGLALDPRMLVLLAVAFGGIAIGASLNNGLPAGLLFLVLLLASTGGTRRLALALVVAVAIVGLFGLTVIDVDDSGGGRLGELVRAEVSWAHPPTFGTVGEAFKNGVVQLFGVPETGVRTWTWRDGRVGEAIDGLGPSWLSILAATTWLLGIFLALRPFDRRHALLFVAVCAVAILMFVSFHACYASREAYIFSYNVWPFVVAPGVAATAAALRRRDRVALAAMAAAVALASLQTYRGLDQLLAVAAGL